MSDPLSNREIEDVLISIRRLVAQEGGRQTESTRLILTEAQRVLDQVAKDTVAADITAEAVAALTHAEPSRGDAMPAPDFGQLEATIAELEAAVSTADNSWEAEGETTTPAVSNVTELYGRLSFNRRPVEVEVEVEPEVEPEIAVDSAPEADAQAPMPDAEARAPAEPQIESAEPAAEAPVVADAPQADGAMADVEPAPMPAAAAAEPEFEPEFEPAFEPEPEDAFLDEEMLRALIAQMVRDELHGQLGERITQQVRKLVRAEIAKALADRTVF